MREDEIRRLNSYFEKWDGARAYFNKYSDLHDQLILGLAWSSAEEDQVGISFFYCIHLAGPVRWGGVKLRARTFVSPSGDEGFEIRDDSSGFVVQCLDSVVVGDNELVVPRR